MWVVPMFVATTWWSWRAVSTHSTGLTRRLIGWGSLAAFGVGASLVLATVRTTDESWLSPIWLVWGGAIGAIAVLMVIDVDVQLLPRELSLSMFVFVIIVTSMVEGPSDSGRWGPLFGALVMTFVTALLRAISRGSLGMGDVLVSPLLGSILGWFDPRAILSAWLVAAVAGGLAAIVSLRRGAPRQRLVAYGPFLFLGTTVALVGTAL